VSQSSTQGSILNQILRPIESFPQSLKSVRIIRFAFFLDGSIAKAAYQDTQTFDRLAPDVEGFRQSVFQGFALGIECLLGWGRDRNGSVFRKNMAKSLQNIPSVATVA
jgi:hypothetical protein